MGELELFYNNVTSGKDFETKLVEIAFAIVYTGGEFFNWCNKKGNILKWLVVDLK